MIAIESDIPIPDSTRDKGYTHAMRTMQAGESVFFPNRPRNGIVSLYRRIPGKFTARAVQGGVRIWRLE